MLFLVLLVMKKLTLVRNFLRLGTADRDPWCVDDTPVRRSKDEEDLTIFGDEEDLAISRFQVSTHYM